MDNDEKCYANSPLRGQEEFYREAQARCPDRPRGTLTGFERWLDMLDGPLEQEGLSNRVRSRMSINAIVQVSSIQGLDPGHQIRVLGHNCTKEEWFTLVGTNMKVRFQDRRISRERVTMLRRGHHFYHVEMDEHGYDLVQTVFHAVQMMARGRPCARRVHNQRILRRRVGVTPRGAVTVPLENIIAAMRKRNDKSRVILIGRKFPDGICWEVWKVRVVDGHTTQNLKNTALSIKLTASHYDLTPRIAHGTQVEVIYSILSCGLRRMGRQCVTLSALPRWDRRIGYGQRSGVGQWTAIVFLSKDRVLRGSEARHLRLLPITTGGASGTMSVNADILPQYIEKVVATVPTLLAPWRLFHHHGRPGRSC